MGSQFDECVRQHLDFIQSSIARMNSCSFQMKGWAGTIVAALLALCAAIKPCLDNPLPLLVASGVIPLVAFACLDAYYLMLERRFRKIYNEVVGQDEIGAKIPPYAMPLSDYSKGRCSFWGALLSASILGFYLPMISAYICVLYFAWGDWASLLE